MDLHMEWEDMYSWCVICVPLSKWKSRANKRKRRLMMTLLHPTGEKLCLNITSCWDLVVVASWTVVSLSDWLLGHTEYQTLKTHSVTWLLSSIYCWGDVLYCSQAKIWAINPISPSLLIPRVTNGETSVNFITTNKVHGRIMAKEKPKIFSLNQSKRSQAKCFFTWFACVQGTKSILIGSEFFIYSGLFLSIFTCSSLGICISMDIINVACIFVFVFHSPGHLTEARFSWNCFFMPLARFLPVSMGQTPEWNSKRP